MSELLLEWIDINGSKHGVSPEVATAFNNLQAELLEAQSGKQFFINEVRDWKKIAAEIKTKWESAERLLQEREDTVDEIERITGFDWERDQLPLTEHIRRKEQEREMQMAGLVEVLEAVAPRCSTCNIPASLRFADYDGEEYLCDEHKENHFYEGPGKVDDDAEKAKQALSNLPSVEKYRKFFELLDQARYMLHHTACKDEQAHHCPACSLESQIDEAFRAIKEST